MQSWNAFRGEARFGVLEAKPPLSGRLTTKEVLLPQTGFSVELLVFSCHQACSKAVTRKLGTALHGASREIVQDRSVVARGYVDPPL